MPVATSALVAIIIRYRPDLRDAGRAQTRDALQMACMGEISLSEYLPAFNPSTESTWKTIKIPLSKFYEAGADFLNLSSPFLIYSEHPVRFRLGNIRFQPD